MKHGIKYQTHVPGSLCTRRSGRIFYGWWFPTEGACILKWRLDQRSLSWIKGSWRLGVDGNLIPKRKRWHWLWSVECHEPLEENSNSDVVCCVCLFYDSSRCLEALIKHSHSFLTYYVDFRYTLPRILQKWLGHFCKLTVDFRCTLPRILQEWLGHFCKLTVDFRYTLPRILQEWVEHFCKLTVAFRYTLPRILQEWLEDFAS